MASAFFALLRRRLGQANLAERKRPKCASSWPLTHLKQSSSSPRGEREFELQNEALVLAYLRTNELDTVARVLQLLEDHRLRRVRAKKDAVAVMAMLEDKAAFVKRAGATNTLYIGVTTGVLIDRIRTDEALAQDDDKIHGLQIELDAMLKKAVLERQEEMIPLIASGHWGPDGPANSPPGVTFLAPLPPAAAATSPAALASASPTGLIPAPSANNCVHSCNAENLAIALFGKERLLNLDDGGRHSEAPRRSTASSRCLLLGAAPPRSCAAAHGPSTRGWRAPAPSHPRQHAPGRRHRHHQQRRPLQAALKGQESRRPR